jgi:hypothetical protein
VAAVAVGLAAPVAAQASNGIGMHGPATEASGWFPEWYEDAAGTKLELCVEGPNCLAAAEGGVPDPGSPISFPDNFPEEAFWWSGETTLTYAGGSALLVMAQEAAFLSGPVAEGDQTAFGRVRIRATGLIPNAWYRFTYPYGQLDLQAVDKAPRVVNYTADTGCLAPPCDDDAFSSLSGSAIGPEFLQWDATESAPPEGYIGSPTLSHRVTGSRFVAPGETEPANYFRIERITGNGGTVMGTVGRTDFFLVQGKLAGAPHGHFAGAPVQFGDRQVGSTAERTATIRNTGSGDLELGRPEIVGNDIDDFAIASGGSCDLPGTLGAGQSCTVRILFAPSVARGHSARLEVPEETSGDATIRSIALTGTGTATPVLITVPPTPPAVVVQPPAVPPVTPPNGGVLDQTVTSSRAAISRFTVRSVAARSRVRAEGLRLVFNIKGEANVVRVRIYKMHGARRGARVVQLYRSATGNPVRLRIADRTLRRRLTAGRYQVEVAAGLTRDTLGTIAKRSLRVR